MRPTCKTNTRVAPRATARPSGIEFTMPPSRKCSSPTRAGGSRPGTAALATTAWGTALPTELRAQRARIEAARGDLKAAVSGMQEVLSADPHYLDGWGALADWQCELRDSAGYLAAAEQLQRLAPNDPHALGLLAHANRLHGTTADPRGSTASTESRRPTTGIGSRRRVST